MPTRSSKLNKKDENETAFGIMQVLTADGKNMAAVALGHLGGLKGGNARAKKLSVERRREIAKKAATVRWSKKLIQKRKG